MTKMTSKLTRRLEGKMPAFKLKLLGRLSAIMSTFYFYNLFKINGLER